VQACEFAHARRQIDSPSPCTRARQRPNKRQKTAAHTSMLAPAIAAAATNCVLHGFQDVEAGENSPRCIQEPDGEGVGISRAHAIGVVWHVIDPLWQPELRPLPGTVASYLLVKRQGGGHTQPARGTSPSHRCLFVVAPNRMTRANRTVGDMKVDSDRSNTVLRICRFDSSPSEERSPRAVAPQRVACARFCAVQVIVISVPRVHGE